MFALMIAAAAAATSLDVAATTIPDVPSRKTWTATELQAQLNAAIMQRKNEFVVPPGRYNFTTVSPTASFNISGAASMRLVATDVAFLFSCIKSQAPVLCPGVNIVNCDGLNVSGLSIDYYNIPQARHSHRFGSAFNPGIPGITYNVLNSSDVISEDVTIHNAPYFVVTAFNGGGGHVFRRFHLPGNATHFNHGRDAFHFTDLRRGVTVEDSDGGYCGDDFFNSHNTIMLVLKQESPTSLLVINPHVVDMYTKYGKNTIYGANCVLETVRAGDQMSFFSFTNDTYVVKPLGNSPSAAKGTPQQVTDASVIADAHVLAQDVQHDHSTVNFDPTDIWRVQFASPVPAQVVRGSLINIDSISTPGTVIRNNTFIHSKYHFGRFKSNGGRIINNTFLLTSSQIEVSPLLQFFEGNLPVVRDVVIAGNTFVGESPKITMPILCSPMSCGGKSGVPCVACPQDSPFSKNITVFGNNITS
jgi:hypothetical protein